MGNTLQYLYLSGELARYFELPNRQIKLRIGFEAMSVGLEEPPSGS